MRICGSEFDRKTFQAPDSVRQPIKMGTQRVGMPIIVVHALRKARSAYFFFGAAAFGFGAGCEAAFCAGFGAVFGAGLDADSGLTLSFRNLPGLNATVLLAFICTGSPV